MLKSIDELIQEKISDREEKEKQINELQKKLQDIHKKQKEEFFTLAKKILPLIEYFQERNYYFKHDNTEYVTPKGPIIGYNSNENMLYIYKRGDLVTQINLRNEEETNLFFEQFIENNSFESAITGLYNVLKLQDAAIEKYEAEIARTNKELETVINFS